MTAEDWGCTPTRPEAGAMTMPSTAPRRAYTGAQSQWLNALDAFFGIIRPTRPRRAAR